MLDGGAAIDNRCVLCVDIVNGARDRPAPCVALLSFLVRWKGQLLYRPRWIEIEGVNSLGYHMTLPMCLAQK